MGDHRHEEEGHPRTPNAWLVIPYFQADAGRPGVERPVPAHLATSWLCGSIVVNGVPGGTTFERGEPFTVAVEVANWGAGAVPDVAWVRLWWADPTLAFSAATLCGQTAVVVPPDGQPVRSGTMTVTVPEGASAHTCLLANVVSPLDGTADPVVPSPGLDRKWAQLNLVEIAQISADGEFRLDAWLGNPFAQPTRSRAAVSVVAAEAARVLGGTLGHDLFTDTSVEAQLLDGEGNDVSLSELEPHETRPITLIGHLDSPPARGQRIALTIEQQLYLAEDPEQAALTGSLGVLLLGSS